MPFYTPTAKEEQELRNWFMYHAPVNDQSERYNILRTNARQFAEAILSCVPPSADRTAAIRKLREAVMTANAGIACGEVYGGPNTPTPPIPSGEGQFVGQATTTGTASAPPPFIQRYTV